MPYKEPVDLKKVPVQWTDWSLDQRIEAAKNYDALEEKPAPEKAKRVAVAISMVEQPNKIPCNNCAGIMSLGETHPWGWSCGWRRPPCGYAMIKEGQTGNLAPFLAFDKPQDSLYFVIDRVVARNIETGVDYVGRWVGIKDVNNPKAREIIAEFEQVYAKVIDAWVLQKPTITKPAVAKPPETVTIKPESEICQEAVVWWKSKRFRSGLVTLLGGVGGAVFSIAQGNWATAAGSIIITISSALGIWWGVRDSGKKIVLPQFLNKE